MSDEKVLPHIYLLEGRWWCAPHGREHRFASMASRPSFAETCHLAQLAAIYSGAWRA